MGCLYQPVGATTFPYDFARKLVDAYDYSVFTDEDIRILLSRDEEAVLRHFALDTTFVVGNRAYSPLWLYAHTVEDYTRVGITPEMVAEKLPLYAEFYLADEADVAFSRKLSEFLGEEISLRQMRSA